MFDLTNVQVDNYDPDAILSDSKSHHSASNVGQKLEHPRLTGESQLIPLAMTLSELSNPMKRSGVAGIGPGGIDLSSFFGVPSQPLSFQRQSPRTVPMSANAPIIR